MSRAERDAQDDAMHEVAWHYKELNDYGGTVNYTVYDDPKKITCGEVLIAGLIFGAIVITILVYLWR